MYFNLAFKNVKKSYKDYFVYFITLTISVALFYLFNSFEAQQQIIVTDESTVFAFDTLTMAMGVLSYFVTLVFGFLILYANNFIMKRRKKEIALYTLLGMKKSRVSRIMLYETFIVGLFSLITGISFGIVLSQGVAAFTGYLLEMEIAYRFVISTSAVVSTLFSFTLIFIIVGIFNNISMSKAKLIDLFKARQSNEVVLVEKPIVTIFIMVVSILTLGFLYVIIQVPLVLVILLLPILVVGSLATLGVFYGISFWFVRISQRLKRYYNRDLNAFTTRQISSKISSTYKLLTSVSLMLLLSFGALATAFNVNDMVNRTFNADHLYDVSASFSYVVNGEEENYDAMLFQDTDFNRYSFELTGLGLTTFDIVESDLNNPSGSDNHPMIDYSLPIELMSVDDYNIYRTRSDKETVSLKDHEVLYFMPDNYFTGNIQKTNLLKPEFTLFETQLNVKDEGPYYMNISEANRSSFIIVATDELIVTLKSQISPQNPGVNTLVVNLEGKDTVISKAESEVLQQEFREAIETQEFLSFGITSKTDNLMMAKQSTLLLTYIGLYLGLTFIVVCVMVISLQLLSEATDSYERYLLLDKIGVSEKLQKRAIFKQNFIYFSLPLVIALIHSFVGIKAVNANLAAGGLRTENYGVIIFAVGILVSIYVIYFFTTYFSSIRMIFDRKK